MGHLIVAQEALDKGVADLVLFVPAGRPWLKADHEVTEAAHRLAMVCQAVSDNPGFEVTDMEITREGPTYTLDTLRELRSSYGQADELILVLGTDALAEIDRWREPEQVMELARVVAFTRPGSTGPDLRSLGLIAGSAEQRVTLVSGPMIEISGTDIRRRVADRLSVRYLVPDGVARYIADHGLYRSHERSRSESGA